MGKLGSDGTGVAWAFVGGEGGIDQRSVEGLRRAAEDLERFVGVGGGDDAEAVLAEGGFQDVAQGLLVVGDEDEAAVAEGQGFGGRWTVRVGSGLGGGAGQIDFDAGAGVRFAAQGDESPWAWAMRATVARPRPVPWPAGLVEKKGSKTWATISGAMPRPVSATRSMT